MQMLGEGTAARRALRTAPNPVLAENFALEYLKRTGGNSDRVAKRNADEAIASCQKIGLWPPP
jgi:hypothetical protein